MTLNNTLKSKKTPKHPSMHHPRFKTKPLLLSERLGVVGVGELDDTRDEAHHTKHLLQRMSLPAALLGHACKHLQTSLV